MNQYPFLRGERSVPDGEVVADEGGLQVITASRGQIAAEHDVARGDGRYVIVRIRDVQSHRWHVVNVQFYVIIGRMVNHLWV